MTFAATLAHGQILEIQSPEDWRNAKGVKAIENGEVEITGKATLISKKSFKIDPEKIYRISAEFKTAEGTPGMSYLGFLVRDEKGRQISAYVVNAVPNTQTEVLEAVAVTDTQIKIKDGSKWKFQPHHRIVLNAADDYSDLPNNAMINVAIKEVKQDGDVYVVTLEKAVGKAIDAGTKIRLHAGGGYLYTGSARKAGNDWMTLSGTIGGIAKFGWDPRSWPKSTATAEILILANWPNSEAKTLVRNIKVEEVEKK
jgi:hypothetical protein